MIAWTTKYQGEVIQTLEFDAIDIAAGKFLIRVRGSRLEIILAKGKSEDKNVEPVLTFEGDLT
jgi:hypothetical protein